MNFCRDCHRVPTARRGQRCPACAEAAAATQRMERKLAPLPERRALPVVGPALREGHGERFADCARERACLEAFIATRTRREADAPAFCPPRCRWREAAPRVRATEYVSLNGAARGAA